jgi:hypothetical protein
VTSARGWQPRIGWSFCQPFGGPEKVLEYLSRYTHRVAVSNRRLLNVADGKVTFSYRDRRDGNQVKELTVRFSLVWALIAGRAQSASTKSPRRRPAKPASPARRRYKP